MRDEGLTWLLGCDRCRVCCVGCASGEDEANKLGQFDLARLIASHFDGLTGLAI
jgi:hypothetical protein